jgi:hypothetical protein
MLHVLGPGGYGVSTVRTPGDQIGAARVEVLPDRQTALAQEIFVVSMEFFQAGPGGAGELQFDFLGGGRGFAAFHDVLHAGARGLNHLVVSAALAVNVFVAEAHGHVINDFSHLEALELSIAAVFGNQF